MNKPLKLNSWQYEKPPSPFKDIVAEVRVPETLVPYLPANTYGFRMHLQRIRHDVYEVMSGSAQGRSVKGENIVRWKYIDVVS